jgi:alanyl-tRNA synthetase
MLMACAVDERDAASGWVVISPSPFYAESGGQVGDVGQIRIFLSDASSMTLSVLDVQNAFDGCSVLRVCTSSENDASGASRSDNALSMLDLMDALNSSSSQTSAHASSLVFGLKDARRVDARVDAVRRNRIRIHHTATHLLHAALRRVLGEHRVVQAGSKVDDARLRFDFTFSRGLSKDELTAVQVDVEKAIAAALSVNTNEMLLEEATKSGAAALFSEKYADKVRVVSAGDGSKELCGGTHAESTAELYPFRIMSEGSVAAGTRRIEAVAGPAAVRVLEEESQLLHQVATLVGDKVSAVPARIKQLQEKQSACEASLWKATHQLVAKSVQERAQVTLPSRSSQQVLCCFLQSGMSEMPAALKGHPDVLRAVLSDIQQQNPSSVVALIADARLMVSSPPALHADLPALGVMNDLLAVLGGKGGGSKEFSQGRMAAAYSWDQLLQRVAASLPVAKSA